MLEYLADMHSHGLEPGHFPLDGKIHRFKAGADDYKKSGWAIGYQNTTLKSAETFYVVIYGNFRDPDSPWKFISSGVTYTAEDRKASEAQIRKSQKIAEAERARAHEEASDEYNAKWADLSTDGTSEYLEKKQITNCPDLGVRFDAKTGDIYVPVVDIDGKLWSLQRINLNEERKKKFMPGGRITDNFHVVGQLNEGKIYFAEGLATAASVSMATGEGVVCVLSASNMDKVVGQFKRKYPDSDLIICADSDHTGIEVARKVSTRFATKMIHPIGHKDWNDVHCAEGLEKIRIHFEEKEKKPVVFDRMAIIRVPYPDDIDGYDTHRGTMANTVALLNRVGIVVRYNVISKEEEYIIRGKSFSIDNHQNAALAHIIDWHERVKIPHANLTTYLTAIADENQYNPVMTWVESQPWDGVERFDKFCGTIVAKHEKEDINVLMLKAVMIRKWMISAIAGAFEPKGVSAHGVLTLQGDQYLGKTKWFKSLVPQELGLTADGMVLNPNNRDSVVHVISKWLVELGELDGTLRSDGALLKAFLTKKNDELRRSHAQKNSHYVRRTVFFASVNETAFLKDPTGNRRFWVIECEKIDHTHNFDMQQVWAEVLTFYRAGESYYMDGAEMDQINLHNENFQQVTPIEEMIRDYYGWDVPGPTHALSATQVCIEVGIREPSRVDVVAAGAVLRKLNCRVTTAKGLKRFHVPLKSK